MIIAKRREQRRGLRTLLRANYAYIFLHELTFAYAIYVDLPVEPRLRQLRRHRRCGIPRLEQAHRQALENHVDWYAQMGTRRSNSMTVGISPNHIRRRRSSFRIRLR